jgi:hypothetical protein
MPFGITRMGDCLHPGFFRIVSVNQTPDKSGSQ